MINNTISKKLRATLKLFLDNLEKFLCETTQKSQIKFEKLLIKANNILKHNTCSKSDNCKHLTEQARVIFTTANKYVHKNPWIIISISTIISFIIGALIIQH